MDHTSPMEQGAWSLLVFGGNFCRSQVLCLEPGSCTQRFYPDAPGHLASVFFYFRPCHLSDDSAVQAPLLVHKLMVEPDAITSRSHQALSMLTTAKHFHPGSGHGLCTLSGSQNRKEKLKSLETYHSHLVSNCFIVLKICFKLFSGFVCIKHSKTCRYAN